MLDVLVPLCHVHLELLQADLAVASGVDIGEEGVACVDLLDEIVREMEVHL